MVLSLYEKVWEHVSIANVILTPQGFLVYISWTVYITCCMMTTKHPLFNVWQWLKGGIMRYRLEKKVDKLIKNVAKYQKLNRNAVPVRKILTGTAFRAVPVQIHPWLAFIVRGM